MSAIHTLLVSCLLTLSSAARQPTMMLPNDVDNVKMYYDVPTIAPVIGVLTQPVGPQSEANISYFPASYAKYAEMGGARVVPVLCDSSEETLTDLFGKLNGLVVPGVQCGALLCRSYQTRTDTVDVACMCTVTQSSPIIAYTYNVCSRSTRNLSFIGCLQVDS